MLISNSKFESIFQVAKYLMEMCVVWSFLFFGHHGCSQGRFVKAPAQDQSLTRGEWLEQNPQHIPACYKLQIVISCCCRRLKTYAALRVLRNISFGKQLPRTVLLSLVVFGGGEIILQMDLFLVRVSLFRSMCFCWDLQDSIFMEISRHVTTLLSDSSFIQSP